ncbi:hypothetical protein J4232_02555 [Candidatus Woesearchaeota archaeon]|nr:hypothetical protein [Candidatus Woesearchaeota archaeon]
MMKCKLCKKETKTTLCRTCNDFLQWMYPKDNPEDILERYRKADQKNGHKRLRK